MGVLFHVRPRQGACPYCYPGVLYKDPDTGLPYCGKCKYAVEFPTW